MASVPKKEPGSLASSFGRSMEGMKASAERVGNILSPVLNRVWSSDFFLPVLFFVMVAASNAHLWRAQVDEMGDQALIGLQTERASRFVEMVGPYSRAGFHHPGPVSFYAYAAFDRLFRFIASSDVRYRFGQLAINASLFFWAVSLLRHLVPSRAWLTGASIAFLVGTAPLESNFLLSVWGPHILIVAYLLFFAAYLSVLQGRGEFLAAAVSAVFILHNHVSGVTLLLPLAFIGALSYLRAVRVSRASFDRRAKWELSGALAFVFVTSIPPLVDQFILSGPGGRDGNLAMILHYFSGAGAASRKFDQVLPYIMGYYADPFKGVIPLPGVLFFSVLSVLPLVAWQRLSQFWRTLYAQLLLVFGLSLFSALRVSGDLLPHLFWHLYPLVGLQYLVFVASLVALLRVEAPAPLLLRLHGSLVVMALCLTVFRLPVVPGGRTTVSDLYDGIKDQPDPYRLVFPLGSQDHNRWVEAAGVALKIVRSGRRYCVDSEWGFMFPRGAVCGENFSGTIVRLTSSESGSVRVITE